NFHAVGRHFEVAIRVDRDSIARVGIEEPIGELRLPGSFLPEYGDLNGLPGIARAGGRRLGCHRSGLNGGAGVAASTPSTAGAPARTGAAGDAAAGGGGGVASTGPGCGCAA